MSKIKKKVKVIKINVDKCNGCRPCEAACSSLHARPKYSSINPARSRIRVIREPIKDIHLSYMRENIVKLNVPIGTSI